VLAANQAFYDAFEAADLDAMSNRWEHSDRVVCTHPGWGTLRGWGKVVASWYAIFGNSQRLQFILTDHSVVASGDTAWVALNENLLDGQGAGSTVAALNVFVRTDGDWLVVAHHGSPVLSR
jgi:ketosteroid isomerase-like protein